MQSEVVHKPLFVWVGGSFERWDVQIMSMQAYKIRCTDNEYICDMFRDYFERLDHVSKYKTLWPRYYNNTIIINGIIVIIAMHENNYSK